MNVTDWTGFLGVFMILLAYFLNITNRLATKDLTYILLNLIGACLACLASTLLQYWPFILLEGVWALVSVAALNSYFRVKDTH